ESAVRLCNAGGATIWRIFGDRIYGAHNHGQLKQNLTTIDSSQMRLDVIAAISEAEPDRHRTSADGFPLSRLMGPGRAGIDRRTVHVEDLLISDDLPASRVFARYLGHRTTLSVPMLSHGEPIGVITVMRYEVRPF